MKRRRPLKGVRIPPPDSVGALSSPRRSTGVARGQRGSQMLEEPLIERGYVPIFCVGQNAEGGYKTIWLGPMRKALANPDVRARVVKAIAEMIDKLADTPQDDLEILRGDV